MRPIKYISSVLFLAAACGLPASVQAATVEVEFSGLLAERMAQIDRLEHRLEKEFRSARSYGAPRTGSRMHQTKARYAKVAWAGDTLVPDLDDFSLMNLTKAMSAEAVNRAGLGDLPGTLRVKLDSISIQRYGVAAFRSSQNSAMGEMEYVDVDGTIRSVKIGANLAGKVFQATPTGLQNFAFSGLDVSRRAGPILAEFIHQGITKLFSVKKVPGPVFARN